MSQATRGSEKRKYQAERDELPARKRRRVDDTGVVLSWNMQGGGSDWTGGKGPYLREILGEEETNVVLLQECTDVFGNAGAGQFQGWSIFHQTWSVTGTNTRCSLAILSRTRPSQTKIFDASWAQGRPMIGAKMGTIWFWTVHAPSGGNSDYIKSAIQACKIWSGDHRWILGGDFNLDLLTVAPVNISNPTGVAVVNSGLVTQKSGGELDYFYVSSGFMQSNYTSCIRARVRKSDHYAVSIEYAKRQ